MLSALQHHLFTPFSVSLWHSTTISLSIVLLKSPGVGDLPLDRQCCGEHSGIPVFMHMQTSLWSMELKKKCLLHGMSILDSARYIVLWDVCTNNHAYHQVEISKKTLWRTTRQYLHMHECLCSSTFLPNSVVRHSHFCQPVGCGEIFHDCFNCVSIINQTEHLLCALWPFQLLVLAFALSLPWLISTYRWWWLGR